MKSAFLHFGLFFAALLSLALPREAAAQLEMKVSVKFILSSTGSRPPGGALFTDDDVRAAYTNVNNLMDTFHRGYRFRITEIVDIAGHSEAYDVDVKTASEIIKSNVDVNPVAFGWRQSAANLYINNSSGGGSAFNGMVVIGHDSGYKTIMHESGHHWGLCHTQGCGCQSCTDCGLTSDGIDDTLPDRQCWTENDIAVNYYHSNFAQLSASQQAAVSNTFNNVMSYHNDGTHDVLTIGQLDKMADTANSLAQSNIVTGYTWFVDRANTCTQRSGSSACTNGTGGPFQTVTGGINNANSGDIVLVRLGNYNEPMTITKAVTLRATRGNAIIGIP
jgi:hypothetical protein